ncbi:MAG TPA: SRPBCC family protein [Dokdonella sp.]|nr:SRPBCC family protein [Dokdonella sp.]
MLIVVTILVLLAAALLVTASTGPAVFSVQRGTVIRAAPERVFPLVDDFRRWREWSPWEERDPSMKRTLSGATSGAGAAYAWSGNKDVGTGRMEIVESTPYSRIAIRLHFIRPFEAHDIATFTFAADGDTTIVDWVMHGPNRFLSKVMQVFMDMDRMIGKGFEAGLAKLKPAAESA